MSNFLAVATVTAALRGMLDEAVQHDVPGAVAVTGRPDRDTETPDTGVNIYLYQAVPSPHYRAGDLPSRDGSGRLVQKPSVALDLYYLLSFYGEEAAYEPQRVLGSVMRTLHYRPLLDRHLLSDTVAAEVQLAASDLPQVTQPVRVTPLALSLEEISRVWSIFFQTPYALSAAYVASTVFMEGDELPRRPLPVLQRNISVSPFRRVLIEAAFSGDGVTAPIVLGGSLVLRGRGLGSGIVRVQIGAAVVDAADLTIAADRIEIPLSEPGLRPGIQGVQTFHTGLDRSNVVPVVVRPVIKKTDGHWQVAYMAPPESPEPPEPPEPPPEPPEPPPEHEEPPFEAAPEGTITVILTTVVGAAQGATLYLNEVPPVPPATDPERTAYTVTAEPREADGDTLTFRLPPPEALAYVVRVEVDGAESMLARDDATGQFNAPLVDLTGT